MAWADGKPRAVRGHVIGEGKARRVKGQWQVMVRSSSRPMTGLYQFKGLWGCQGQVERSVEGQG
jgi:hypothetical protein